MSTAEMLRAEGHAEGLAEGVGKGAVRLLVRQLTRRFETVPPEVRARIDTASLEQLDIWSERVLDAATLDEGVRLTPSLIRGRTHPRLRCAGRRSTRRG